MTFSRKVVIIGSGPAACTAAIYSARAALDPLVFAGCAWGGQLMITTDVENFPGFAEPLLGPELMERMRKQCERLGVSMIFEDAVQVDLSRRPFSVTTTEGTQASSEVLIIATGAKAKLLGLESEKRLMGHGVSACATCDGIFFKDKNVAVVGGGDTALEEALFLARFAGRVTVIHRRDSLRACAALVTRAKRQAKINFLWDSIVVEILGRDFVRGLRLKNVKSGATRDFVCQGLFVAIGHTPAVEFLGGRLKLDANGFLAADARGRTSIDGVFAAGDVADSRYRQAVTAAGSGCIAALEAERFLAGHE